MTTDREPEIDDAAQSLSNDRVTATCEDSERARTTTRTVGVDGPSDRRVGRGDGEWVAEYTWTRPLTSG